MQQVLQSGSFTIRNFELISPIGWKRPEQDWYDGQAHPRGTHMIGKWEMSQPVSILQGRTGQSWVYLAAVEVTDPTTFSQDLKLCTVFVKASVCPFLYHFVGYGGMRVSRELSRRETTCGGLTHVGTHHVLSPLASFPARKVKLMSIHWHWFKTLKMAGLPGDGALKGSLNRM